jgi:hypothetical protein
LAGVAGVAFVSPAAVAADTTEHMHSLKEIRQYAVVMQHYETSCAAAAVATVLTYGFHDPVSEEYAASKMLEKTDAKTVKARGGFSLLDLKHFVEDRGYTGDGYQYLSIDDLRLFRAPIVPIKVFGSNHYVVVNAIRGDDVMLADPAFGNRTMSADDFKSAWIDGMAFVISTKTEKS